MNYSNSLKNMEADGPFPTDKINVRGPTARNWERRRNDWKFAGIWRVLASNEGRKTVGLGADEF